MLYTLFLLIIGQWKYLNYEIAVPTKFLPLQKFGRRKSSVLTKARHERLINRSKTKLLFDNEKLAWKALAIENHEVDIEKNNSCELDVIFDEESASNVVDDIEKQISVSSQTIITLSRSQLISYSMLQAKNLNHFTGFSKEQFTVLCQCFRKDYKRNYLAILCIEDEVLITLIKYRLNLFYLTIAKLFDVDRRLVKKIVFGWSRHFHQNLRKIDFWNSAVRFPLQYTVVLDCTEFRIERSKDPIVQQTTYSNYYGTNTLKVLVGCTENGQVCFVSDAYGGSITDRKITESSGILNLVEETDFILADRGFDISDLLEDKGVVLNIPPFKRNKQLTEEEIIQTRAIANRRIIIENIIGSAKKNKILIDRITTSTMHIVNEIIYNCFMFTNFKGSLVK